MAVTVPPVCHRNLAAALIYRRRRANLEDAPPLPRVSPPASSNRSVTSEDSTTHQPSSVDSPTRHSSSSSSPSDYAPNSQPKVVMPRLPASDPNFKWKDLSGIDCVEIIDKCYSKAVHWIPNLVKVPYCRSFVKEMARLFCSYSESSALECIALKAVFLLPLLVLQNIG